jgi:ferredoxin-NADP reductase
MNKPDAAVEDPIVARVVHKSVVVDQAGTGRVVKLMLNLTPQGRSFAAGSDVAFLAPGYAMDSSTIAAGLRRYTVESVGAVPFEDSIDVTIFVRDHDPVNGVGMAHHLIDLAKGDTVAVYGPFAYPFYPPMGSRSNMVLIGAGCGMVPFRWLAHKVQARKLDWMGKVLMLEGPQTGLEHLYLNDPDQDQDQYFDTATYRAFEALKTRYSATALDRRESTVANMDALWRLMGQGSVFVYLAGYRAVAEAMDEAMALHLRLPGRWQEARSALVKAGHWLEFLYD